MLHFICFAKYNEKLNNLSSSLTFSGQTVRYEINISIQLLSIYNKLIYICIERGVHILYDFSFEWCLWRWLILLTSIQTPCLGPLRLYTRVRNWSTMLLLNANRKAIWISSVFRLQKTHFAWQLPRNRYNQENSEKERRFRSRERIYSSYFKKKVYISNF